MVTMDLVTRIKLALLPAHRRVYFVADGSYKGEWLVQISSVLGHTVFLSLPDKQERIIPNKDVKWGLDNKVIVPVDVLPKKVYKVCVAEYNQLKKSVNISQPPTVSSRDADRVKYKQELTKLQTDSKYKSVVDLYRADE